MLFLASSEGVAAITAGATLVAAAGLAGVTLYTTTRRFAEERQSQQRELSAEAERQAARLAHDRELADIANLRATLDEAALLLNQIVAEIPRLRGLSEPAGSAHKDEEEEEKYERLSRLADLLEEWRDLVRPLLARLRVRLGPDDEITTVLAQIEAALSTQAIDVHIFSMGLSSEPEEMKRIKELAKSLKDAEEAFTRAAARRAGAIIASDSVEPTA